MVRAFFRVFPNRFLSDLFARIPYSRFAQLGSRIFSGSEIVEYRDVQIRVNPGDNLGFYAYFLGNRKDPEIETLIDLCSKSRVFVDVGANAGWFSLAIAQACPDIAVLAFEPERRMASEFKDNLKRNEELRSRITLVEKAVGERDGEVYFQPSSSSMNQGIGRIVSGDSASSAYKAEMIRLDSFFKTSPFPDIIKIDVEGAENAVLEGLSGLLALGYPKAVLLETHAFYFGSNAVQFNQEVVFRLTRAGFSILRQSNGEWKLLSQELGDAPRTHLLGIRDSLMLSQVFPGSAQVS